jgi:membrane protein YdbS with pleckstrin-like domain
MAEQIKDAGREACWMHANARGRRDAKRHPRHPARGVVESTISASLGAAADGLGRAPRTLAGRADGYNFHVAFKLSPGEQVIFQGHPSWRAILGFYLKGILITAIVAAIVAAATSLFGDEMSTGLVVVIVIAGVALTILIGLIKRIATTYTITNRRLNIKRGIISREVQETRLERVQNVNYDQSVFQRAMQIGDVDFDTAAGDDYNFIFAGVAQPEEVVEEVDRATRGAHSGLGEPDEEHRAPASRDKPQ